MKSWHRWLLVFLLMPVQAVWAQKAFDHSLTGFDLKDAHKQIECVACHKQDAQTASMGIASYRWTGLRKTCYPCHKDFHGYGREASKAKGPLLQCEACHGELKWKEQIRFDHGKDAIFAITGKHSENSCFDCHKPQTVPQAFKGLNQAKVTAAPNVLRRYYFPSLPKKSCETCHLTPHPPAFHKKFAGITCEKCHGTNGWQIIDMSAQINKDRSFHNKTRFPLTGSHLKTTCKSCHVVNGKDMFKFANAEKDFCVTCHPSVHKQQFSARTVDLACSKCHKTTKFTERLPFDHGITAFILTGAHKKIENKCSECHKPGPHKLATKPPKVGHIYDFDESKDAGFCVECHVSVHKNQFRPETLRRSCGDCHSTVSFDKLLELKQ